MVLSVIIIAWSKRPSLVRGLASEVEDGTCRFESVNLCIYRGLEESNSLPVSIFYHQSLRHWVFRMANAALCSKDARQTPSADEEWWAVYCGERLWPSEATAPRFTCCRLTTWLDSESSSRRTRIERARGYGRRRVGRWVGSFRYQFLFSSITITLLKSHSALRGIRTSTTVGASTWTEIEWIPKLIDLFIS